MPKKGYKLSAEHRLNLSIAHLNSPIIQARKAETARRQELERRARTERIRRQREIWGSYHSPENRQKISQALKGRPHWWNKGKKAWNNGKRWPDRVRENISKGMVAYWVVRKRQQLEDKKAQILETT